MDESRLSGEEEVPRRQLHVFGRDVSQIPCFRNSFLYGIGGGVAIGVATFLGTSRTRLSTHVGFGCFFTGTLTYWLVCRYQWSKKRFEYQQLQEAMRKQSIYEGTDLERQILEDA
ncbi:cytochrome c oxidase assembly protein COX20, mitochondrial isoform X1 [Rhagoletis pomonella]|uniref:cytochrome c oxidase assembly protein COX20, mitochondrial isoform X1 n=1 Tax=Rhagoletis pomonella TaxID=28610 RepID=UPI001786423A|nr:cytochrome c oxidase assembly protein COX20, mitochondrial isoform X1 [Rhagoletis pomonella]